MIVFLQNLIGFIWQPFLSISMPWQAAIMLFLSVLFFPWLVFRAFPWLFLEILKILLAFIWFFFERVLWLDYYISSKRRRIRGKPPLSFSYFLGNLLQGILLNFNEIVKKIRNLQRHASQVKVFLDKKRFWLYLLPLIIPILMWFVTPVLGADNQLAVVMNNSAEFWCSLENWAITGQATKPYFGCHYPGKEPPLANNFQKTKEYTLINQIKKYNLFIEREAKNTELYFKRGSIYFEKGNINLAFQDYNRTLHINADHAPGYKGRGDVYLAKNDKNAAYREYSTAISKDPSYAPGYKGRGDVYLAKNDKNAALQEYKKAIKIDSNYALAYSQQGNLYANKFNKQSLAIKNYKIAANLFRKYGQIDSYESIIKLIKEIESR